MAANPRKSSRKVQVTPATAEQQPTLANLLELYVHDFSEILDLEVGENGRFGYKDLDLYWQDPQRRPFLARIDGKLAGFALVRLSPSISGNHEVWDMTEFFVVRGHRRRGVGTAIANEVWRQLSGGWQVRVMEANEAAREFWERAIAEFAGRSIPPSRVEKDGKWWTVFFFDAP
jgi:predicted acetyltransferase